MKITPDFANEIKSQGLDVITLGHAYRLNGVIDVWFNGRTLFNKKKNEYLNFDNREKLVSTAIYLAHQIGKHDAFSKTKKGNITYQEFKHKESKPIAEYYHWNNDKNQSDKHLYFIKSGVHVKIGISSNPKKRLLELRTGTPEQPKILLIVKNKGHMEKVLHKCFSQWRIRKNGEWFMLSKQIKDFITFIKT
jgi:hypothetical protein